MYTSGRYFVGPDFTFKVFQANAHFVKLDKIAVWTGDKIEIKITCTFQYFLRKDFLPDLHEAYNVDYKPVVKGTAIDAIKGRAADLPIDDYIRYMHLSIWREKSLSENLLLILSVCMNPTRSNASCHTLLSVCAVMFIRGPVVLNLPSAVCRKLLNSKSL